MFREVFKKNVYRSALILRNLTYTMEMLAPKIYWLLTWAYLPQLIITNYNANFCKKLVLISVRRKFNRVTTSVTSLDHNQIECKILQQTGVDISEKKIQSCHHQW